MAANNVYYLIGVLAFDLLQALKLLYLPEDDQPKRGRTLLQHLLLMPIEIKRYARQLKVVRFITAGWMELWKGFLEDLVPHYQLVVGDNVSSGRGKEHQEYTQTDAVCLVRCKNQNFEKNDAKNRLERPHVPSQCPFEWRPST